MMILISVNFLFYFIFIFIFLILFFIVFLFIVLFVCLFVCLFDCIARDTNVKVYSAKTGESTLTLPLPNDHSFELPECVDESHLMYPSFCITWCSSERGER
jgi:hypothetical protein